MDAPWHFNSDGLKAAELPIDRYVFESPLLLDLPKPPGGLISTSDLHARHAELKQADLLLIRTGQSRLRDIEPDVYENDSPVLLADAAAYLMDNFPKLKAIAIDAISIGSKSVLDDTIRSHEILTGVGRTDGRFILIYEDVRIDSDLGEALRIFAWPLFIVESDGSPCTMVAEFADPDIAQPLPDRMSGRQPSTLQ